MNSTSKAVSVVTQYDEFREKITEVEDSCDFIPDVTTGEGYDKSKRVALDVGKILTAVEGRRKELKADSLAFGRCVDAEAKALTDELAVFQLPHKAAYRDLDTLRKQREADRKERIEGEIAAMLAAPGLMIAASLQDTVAALNKLESSIMTGFDEYTEHAATTCANAIQSLKGMIENKEKEEAQAAELERLQAVEIERQRVENAASLAREATKVANKAAAGKLKKARDDKAAAVAATKKAKADAKTREKENIADAAAAQIAAEIAQREAVEAAERNLTQAAEKLERDRLAGIEADRVATEKRESNKRHRAKVNNAAVAALVNYAALSPDDGKAVIIAIASGKIPSINISY